MPKTETRQFNIDGEDLFLDEQGTLRDKDGAEITEEWVANHVW